MRFGIIAFSILTLTGCVNVPPVAGSEVMEPSRLLSCSEMGVTKHCNGWKRSRRTLTLEDRTFDVSSNEEGTKIVIERTTPGAVGDVFLSNPFVFNSPRVSRQTNATYSLVKAYLEKAEINVVKATPMTCLLYTSPSPRDLSTSRMPSSA